MKNVDTSHITKRYPSQRVAVDPILIPITPDLLACMKEPRYHYRVAPSDVLSIQILQHPEFDFVDKSKQFLNTNGEVHGSAGQMGYLVNPNGKINFPLIGYVVVGGKTIEAIHADLQHKLKQYIPNPQIQIRVADYRGQKAYILGEVLKPGKLAFTDEPLTIADALALAGGINPTTANPRYIYVIRGDFLAPKIFWLDAITPDRMLLAERFSLHPQDIVHVSTAPIARWNRFIDQLFPSMRPLLSSPALIAAAL